MNRKKKKKKKKTISWKKNLLTAQHKELTLEQLFSKLTHQSNANRRH